MIKPGFYRALSLVVFALLAPATISVTALGQASREPASVAASGKTDRINYEIQLHLLVASNEAGEKGNVPQSLEAIVRQLKSSLSFANYRLAATFVNRIKDGGTLESRGLIPANLFTPAPTTFVPEAAYEFTLFKIKLDDDLTNIDIPKFRFGLQLPVITGMIRGEANAPPTPNINFQPASINTELNLREDKPTIVGTMNTARSDQMLVLVITVRRVQ
jgi:hypothetical protein